MCFAISLTALALSLDMKTTGVTIVAFRIADRNVSDINIADTNTVMVNFVPW